VPSHSATASGSGSWGQQVTVAEATLPVTATSTSLDDEGLGAPHNHFVRLWHKARARRTVSPHPLPLTPSPARLGHLQSLARWR
jgi:hypothetical protein